MPIAEQLQLLRERLARRGRDVTLIAVSKTHGPEAVREAAAAGQTVFGESRVQEAKAKIPLSPEGLRWHLVGHLQSNKIRQALPLFERLHGIDSLDLARHVNRIAGELGLRPKICLEVNVSGEASKFGFQPETLRASMEELLSLDRLDIDGLMTIPPFDPNPEAARRYFAALRELRDRLGVPLPELSMGMSTDYEVAMEEGATMVRVGTAIFGDREKV